MSETRQTELVQPEKTEAESVKTVKKDNLLLRAGRIIYNLLKSALLLLALIAMVAICGPAVFCIVATVVSVILICTILIVAGILFVVAFLIAFLFLVVGLVSLILLVVIGGVIGAILALPIGLVALGVWLYGISPILVAIPIILFLFTAYLVSTELLIRIDKKR